MVKKIVKRKAPATEVVAESPEDGQAIVVPKKVKKQNTDVAASLDTYQAGGLSSLFGKSTEGTTVQEDVVKGAIVIEKPKRRKYDPKTKDSEDKSKENEKTSTGEAIKEEADSEKKEQKKDRTKQRENRTLSKTNARATAADNAKTVFVGNMPLTMNEKAVRRIFSEFGTVTSVRMRNLIPANEKLTKRVTHLTGKFHDKQSSLTFYVKFDSEESVEKALKYNGTKVEDHVIRVDKVGSKKKDFGKDMAIFAGNLPFDITEDTLINFFTEHVGPVEAVRIVRDKISGQGKGFAFVNFKEDSSVSLALGMETIKMEKREIRITKVMKKGQLTKIQTAKKRTANVKKGHKSEEISGKMHNFKFSTKKQRSAEQNDRRALKKSAKKAIMKKKAAKQGRLMA